MTEKRKCFFAVDLGATSGRTIIGTLHQGKMKLEELTRFDNHIIETGGHFYWDIYALYDEIIQGLKLAHDRQIAVGSIGIDTWGCDFVFVGQDGALMRNPMSYRDPCTMEIMDDYFRKAVSKEEVYERTGIQFMNFNSLFQLYQMKESGNSAMRHASKVLFIPDALSYMLTGKAICEYTVSSTSQLLNPKSGDLDDKLLQSIGLRRDQFGKMTPPATVIGPLTKEIQGLTGLGAVPVIAVAGHDTASAVAAVPATDEKFAYLSSGTWSLMGIENRGAIINKKSFQLNFTNEGGIEGTTRFLKNICGMWLYERCRSEWPELKSLGHQKLQADAARETGFRSLINPDDPVFANPASMEVAIQNYCSEHQEPVPQSPAQICRCIFDSLALRYRQVFNWLKEFAPFPINTLHIIGGGSLNVMLDQFTANSCGIPVLAGPQEGTAIGNIMLQAKASGDVRDIHEMRKIIADSIDLRRYEPQDKAQWDDAYRQYLDICK
ncbi:MAG: rhamnulokinase [Prevotella sp.]|jgi:rhamnulokinase|nr:rhamnulokinase family protein [Prevotella sp.]MCI2136839.1 rhamnulokinase [Prevotella sp.]MCI2150731.1 rhamnulokinase [Prevotella sp.]